MPYTYTSIPYSKKPLGEPNEYHITTTDGLKYLVTSLTDQFNMQECNISCDQFYTYVELVNWLLQKNMIIVETIKSNHKDVGDLKKMDGTKNGSTLIYWKKDKETMTMTSYVTNTKSSGKQNVLVLATTNTILGVTKGDGKSKQS